MEMRIKKSILLLLFFCGGYGAVKHDVHLKVGVYVCVCVCVWGMVLTL